MDHRNDEFVAGNSHINGMEGFWGYAKIRFSKFKEMQQKHFFITVEGDGVPLQQPQQQVVQPVVEKL